MTGAGSCFAAWLAALLGVAGAGCLRLSDPVYASKEIHADAPAEDGRSLIFGSIVIDEFMTGDLNTVSFVKIGPGAERSHRGANRVNLFRVFFPRTMKDGHFIIEVEPGLYELESFSTSGWGQPRTWKTRDEVRRGTRILVTRPGVYDLGTLRVARGENGTYGEYAVERIADQQPTRQEILRRAIAGTPWERLIAARSDEAPGGGGPAAPP